MTAALICIGGVCSIFGAAAFGCCAYEDTESPPATVLAMLVGLVAWPVMLLYVLGKGLAVAPKFLGSGYSALRGQYFPKKPQLPQAKVMKDVH